MRIPALLVLIIVSTVLTGYACIYVGRPLGRFLVGMVDTKRNNPAAYAEKVDQVIGGISFVMCGLTSLIELGTYNNELELSEKRPEQTPEPVGLVPVGLQRFMKACVEGILTMAMLSGILMVLGLDKD